MFTKEALKNISATGNVWGVTIEYVLNRTFNIWRYAFTFKIKRKGAFMGRFGGGWNFVLGIQASGFKDIIISYGIGTLRIRYTGSEPLRSGEATSKESK